MAPAPASLGRQPQHGCKKWPFLAFCQNAENWLQMDRVWTETEKFLYAKPLEFLEVLRLWIFCFLAFRCPIEEAFSPLLKRGVGWRPKWGLLRQFWRPKIFKHFWKFSLKEKIFLSLRFLATTFGKISKIFIFWFLVKSEIFGQKISFLSKVDF